MQPKENLENLKTGKSKFKVANKSVEKALDGNYNYKNESELKQMSFEELKLESENYDSWVYEAKTNGNIKKLETVQHHNYLFLIIEKSLEKSFYKTLLNYAVTSYGSKTIYFLPLNKVIYKNYSQIDITDEDEFKEVFEKLGQTGINQSNLESIYMYLDEKEIKNDPLFKLLNGYNTNISNDEIIELYMNILSFTSDYLIKDTVNLNDLARVIYGIIYERLDDKKFWAPHGGLDHLKKCLMKDLDGIRNFFYEIDKFKDKKEKLKEIKASMIPYATDDEIEKIEEKVLSYMDNEDLANDELVEILDKVKQTRNINAFSGVDYGKQWNLLFYAVTSGDLEFTEFLLKNGANPNIKDEEGIIPLTAMLYNNGISEYIEPMVELMLKYKTNIKDNYLNSRKTENLEQKLRNYFKMKGIKFNERFKEYLV